MTTQNDKSEYILSPLDQKSFKAMEMRFEGYNMKEIADELGELHTTVRQWFAKGGKLNEFYGAYATEEAEARHKEARNTFKAHINNAVRTLVAVMNKSRLDIARVQAAKEIINRQLGEPVKPIEMINSERVNEYLEAIKILDEKIPTNESLGENPSIAKS